MKLSIKNLILQAIIQNKWLDISYVNKKEESTRFYIGIKDIDIEKERLKVDIFNPFKSNEILDLNKNTFIYIEGIKSASILEQSYFVSPKDLYLKLKSDKKISDYLEIINYDNNILRYLFECYKLDNDPYLKEVVMIDGLDLHSFKDHNVIPLDDNQFDQFLDRVFRKSKFEAEEMNRYQTLAINKFSIDINDKQYVVAYKTLSLNFKDKTLKISNKTYINKSFLVKEDKKVTIGMYIDIDPDVFSESYNDHEQEYIEYIKGNFHNGEIVNTRPTIFFLSRDYQHGVDQAFEAIHEMDKEDKLTIPLKALFGRNKCRPATGKEVNIVVNNRDRINIDQLRVVYNSMVNRVTYVKGPPGTGKTETIFNVLLSAYANDKTVLVCSNNNHPVNDIFKKMDKSLTIKKPYSSDTENIIFPMIRIGNNEEMQDTIVKLREIYNFLNLHKRSKPNEELTENSKNKSLSGFKELADLLKQYETKIDLIEKINTIEKIKRLTTIDQIFDKLDEQYDYYNNQYEQLSDIKASDVLKYALSASEDRAFQNYIYYDAMAKFKKLLSPTYKELKEILDIEDIKEAVTQLNKWLSQDLNVKRLLAVFPIVLCTNVSCEKIGTPKPHFDLVIMDEAGQCNIATSLVAILRGDNLLLVGDTNQLQPVTVLEENVNEDLKKKYNISDEYDYIRNSILSTMLRKDNNSKNILLRYHYRCGTKIADFVNQRFYKKQLRLKNENAGNLLYYSIKNLTRGDFRNSYKEEASQIARIIKEKNYKDVGIITPFVNQAMLINDYLSKYGINDVKAGTVHTLQGSEKSVIIMSAAISTKTAKKTMDWIKNNHELINVAVTRAKDTLIFVGDKEAIDVLSKDDKNDIKVLSDYIYENGSVEVPESDAIISYDFSNDSKNEKDFFVTVQPYFNKSGTKMRIERNVPVKNAIKKIDENDLKLIGKKEFDVIVQVAVGTIKPSYTTIVVFEIDGGEHIGSKRTAMLDRQKEEICKKYGIKLIRIANSAVKDYEFIITTFECVTKGLTNIEEAYSQMSLFDDI